MSLLHHESGCMPRRAFTYECYLFRLRRNLRRAGQLLLWRRRLPNTASRSLLQLQKEWQFTMVCFQCLGCPNLRLPSIGNSEASTFRPKCNSARVSTQDNSVKPSLSLPSWRHVEGLGSKVDRTEHAPGLAVGWHRLPRRAAKSCVACAAFDRGVRVLARRSKRRGARYGKPICRH
jgi:hypothetical protein